MSTIIILAIYAIALLIIAGLPSWLQLILLLLNVFNPDPIPYIDELVQLGLFLKTHENK